MHPVPVDLSEEERAQAEHEAAIVYYRDLIDQKLRRGEDLNEDDPLMVKLEEACDAYQRYL